MIRIAIQMLLGDRAKYIALVLGIAFSTLMVVQQSSIFVGVLNLSAYLVRSNPEVDVWVMRQGVESPELIDQMPESWMYRVRGVEGVDWALPLYRGATTARTQDRKLRLVQILGLDDATLAGAPGTMLLGTQSNLNQADGVILDIATFRRLLPGVPNRLGDTLEIGRRRAVIVGICRAAQSITASDTIYARRSVAVQLTQEANDTVSFVMVRAKPGQDPVELARRIEQRTSLRAMASPEFSESVINWTMRETGLVQVLGSVIGLGVVVGILVVGQTFYMFAVENQRYFAALKALGAQNLTVLRMIAAQALLVAVLGYGLGLGAATAILAISDNDLSPMRGLGISPVVAAVAAAGVPVVVLLTAGLGARRALTAEPAAVFKA